MQHYLPNCHTIHWLDWTIICKALFIIIIWRHSSWASFCEEVVNFYTFSYVCFHSFPLFNFILLWASLFLSVFPLLNIADRISKKRKEKKQGEEHAWSILCHDCTLARTPLPKKKIKKEKESRLLRSKHQIGPPVIVQVFPNNLSWSVYCTASDTL